MLCYTAEFALQLRFHDPGTRNSEPGMHTNPEHGMHHFELDYSNSEPRMYTISLIPKEMYPHTSTLGSGPWHYNLRTRTLELNILLIVTNHGTRNSKLGTQTSPQHTPPSHLYHCGPSTPDPGSRNPISTSKSRGTFNTLKLSLLLNRNSELRT